MSLESPENRIDQTGEETPELVHKFFGILHADSNKGKHTNMEGSDRISGIPIGSSA